MLLFAAAGGYLLAGRALLRSPPSPISRRASAPATFGARLDLDLPDDELGRLARTFDAMLARIDDAFERQRRFTGDAAHELRTPLSLMRSQVDLALARPRSTGAYRDACRLDETSERLTGLVGTLLTLARSDAGQLATERAPFDLAETVRLVARAVRPLAEEAGVDLRDETAPAPLVADEDLLVQVLVNLVDNALAHTPAGSGRSSLAAGRRRPGPALGRRHRKGIPAEHQARVFDRFYRVDAGRSRAGEDGLGLAICKAIAEAHGGTIALTSRSGSGTRVELVLPGRQPHACGARQRSRTGLMRTPCADYGGVAAATASWKVESGGWSGKVAHGTHRSRSRRHGSGGPPGAVPRTKKAPMSSSRRCCWNV